MAREAELGLDSFNRIRIALAGKDASVARNRCRRQAIVASDHEEARAGPAAFPDGIGSLRPGRVNDAEDTNHGEAAHGTGGNLVAESVGVDGVDGSDILFAENNDALGVSRQPVLVLFEGNLGSGVEGENGVGLARPVRGAGGEKHVRGTLDKDTVLLGFFFIGVGVHPKSLDGGQTLGQDMDSLHATGNHHERQSNTNGHTLGNKGDDTAHDVVEHSNDIHVCRVVASKPADPSEEDEKGQDDGEADNNADEAPDFSLDKSRTLFGRSSRFGNAAHDGARPSEDDDTDAATVDHQRTHKGNISALEKGLVRHVDGALNLVRLTCQHGAIEPNVARVAQDAQVSRDLVSNREVHNVAGDEVRRRYLDCFSVAHHQGLGRQEVGDGLHGALRRPVLECGEARLESDDNDDEDGEGQVDGRRRVAERLPADEEDDDADPEHRAEAAKHVSEHLFPVIRLWLGQRVAAVALLPVRYHAVRQAISARNVELLRNQIRRELMILEVGKVVLVGLFFLEAQRRRFDVGRRLLRVDGARLGHVDGQRTIFNLYAGIRGGWQVGTGNAGAAAQGASAATGARARGFVAAAGLGPTASKTGMSNK
ncbi:hypothetical protein BM221_010246 [Beauveria bassiana]|uniref:Uncharacterized protein n=1 Tax=Beauveria bassiana TaxID=176275 RepID=A0A2N6N913_BEABA|nr:hypothetical protein BM221_010246 [Beauveria bassiana]